MQPKLLSTAVRMWGNRPVHLYECGYCGKKFEATTKAIARRARMSCGCFRPGPGRTPKGDRQWLPHNPGDIVEHGHKVVELGTSGYGAGLRNLYECGLCGKRFEETKGNVRRTRKSCGCLASSAVKHGGSGTRLYGIWSGMRERCTPGKLTSRHYGDRGIRVCDEWSDYEPFRDWSLENGYAADLSIDRIDVNGDYEPSNCRWIPRREQGRNTRKTVLNEFMARVIRRLWQAGVEPVELCHLFGLPYSARSHVRKVAMGLLWSDHQMPRENPGKPSLYDFLTAVRR